MGPTETVSSVLITSLQGYTVPQRTLPDYDVSWKEESKKQWSSFYSTTRSQPRSCKHWRCAIATEELKKLCALIRLGDKPREICVFAKKVANIITVLKALNLFNYLYDPITTVAISKKLPPAICYRRYDFSDSQVEEAPVLVKLSRFLHSEADLCRLYVQLKPEASEDDNSRRKQVTQYVKPSKGDKSCATCRNKGHSPPDCPDFKTAMTGRIWWGAPSFTSAACATEAGNTDANAVSTDANTTITSFCITIRQRWRQKSHLTIQLSSNLNCIENV